MGRYEGSVGRLDSPRFLPSDLLVDEDLRGRDPNRKPDPEWVKKIALDMYNEGQEQDIGIMKYPNGRYYVVWGYTRHEAGQLINDTMVKPGEEPFALTCRVVRGNDEDSLRMAIRENMLRKDPSQVDLAYAVKMFTNRFKKTPKDIAAIFGKSIGWVDQMFRIISLPAEVLDKIHAGLSVEAAQALAPLEAEIREEVFAEAKAAATVKEAAKKNSKSTAKAATTSAGKKNAVITKKDVTEAARKVATKSPEKAKKVESVAALTFSEFKEWCRKHSDVGPIRSVLAFVEGRMTGDKLLEGL